jgi:hypothetical protein
MGTQRSITFTSRSRDQRVIIQPSFTRFDSRGDKIGVEEGHAIQFVNGTYKTADEAEIAHLRARIEALDGPAIFELGVTDAPPADQALIQLINIAKDHGKVRAFLEDERSTYNRRPVVDACLKVLGEDPEDAANVIQVPAPAAEAPADNSDTHPEDMSIQQLRALAKAQGINTFQKSKAAILAELAGVEA